MHESHDIERELKAHADEIAKKYPGAPVVVIVGGAQLANVPRVMTASSFDGAEVRLRDLLGVLQTSIQIESWKHFRNWK